MTEFRILVQKDDFDLATESERVRQSGVGAIVTFTGTCRDEGGRLAALELEHYPGMAEAEILRIAEEAARRWPVAAITAIHRVGKLKPGDNIVLVIATSIHRQAAFSAAGFVMDFLKTRAPFWKKEHPVDGKEGAWVDAREQDEAVTKDWLKKP